MSKSKKQRYKDHAARREAGGYVPMPHAVLRSHEFAALSPRAVKLLCDLMAQYKGDNNGDLGAALTGSPGVPGAQLPWPGMKARGWSGGSVARALAELQKANFIVTTRQGGRHKASLYADTFYAIDWCGGKLDITAPTRTFMGSWRRSLGVSSTPPAVQIKADCSSGGAIRPGIKPTSPPMEQSSQIPAVHWSTGGHLSRNTTPRSAFAQSC